MADDRVGRVLVASLHQGIADVEPTKLEYYETWLSPSGHSERRVGLASLQAAISFLRREGPEIYGRIMTRAGEAAVDWTFESWGRLERTWMRRLPAGFRRRKAWKLGRQVVASTSPGAKVRVQSRRGLTRIEITPSIFCNVRDMVDVPMCTYYAAAFRRALALAQVEGAVTIRQCRATGGASCAVEVARERASDSESTASA